MAQLTLDVFVVPQNLNIEGGLESIHRALHFRNPTTHPDQR